ncbi:metallophosphoesterase [Catalinimonas niigatensis]|uniref:metallophosphoesterase n=1 Tax=Catalinimonas niigatensis TaxID=1397264 RepID=UPI0026661027|nr:metallophosphoesterase [Catalinimonas niigatensis]WPP52926.1 metallophosphoesterase [Catalinimonas niigatensis]
MYDIIGDIHGEATGLHTLLAALGYRLSGGIYRHPGRKAVFLGDFINKGSDTRTVLQTVRAMVESGAAYAIAGNHELNLAGFFQKHARGEYIRPHTEKNRAQHAPTFADFAHEESLLQEYIAWMKTLPLFLELDGLRVVHAFWHQSSIAYLRQYYPSCRMDDRLLYDMVPGSAAAQAAEELLVGIKLELPPSLGGAPFKTKWWEIGRSYHYRPLNIRPDPALGNPVISTKDIQESAYQYPEDAIPLFFGHYNLAGKPYLLAHNYACLDFNLESRPLVVAYRWDGESRLENNKFVYVGG